MKKNAVAIGDIAKTLGISITTVSFILNGKAKEKRISDALAQRVMKLVNEVGYVPNHLAKSLRTGKTNIIGLIVEDISNPFFANVARLIEENANKRGYKIFYCSSENNTEKTKELIKVFQERQVDGYIITPAKGIEKEVASLLASKAKVVLFDRYLPDLDTNYVVIDNLGGAYNGVKHLIDQGYERIGIVTIESGQTQMKERLEGYKKAVAEYGLKTYIKKVRFCNDAEELTKKILAFLQANTELDAVFFATNYLGISGLNAIRTMNMEISSRFGIVSFDDHDLFRLFSPAITVVAQPIEEISEKLINILLENMSGDNLKHEKLVLPTQLIIRQSTKAKRKEKMRG
jgi:LacI family transcriptional regulator